VKPFISTQKEASMLSNRNRIQLLAAAIAAATVGGTGALASPPIEAGGLFGVTVDRSAVARHRALGQLGEPIHVIADTAVIARHRALGRLPLGPGNGVTQSEASSAGRFPWRESLIGIAVVVACAGCGFLALTRSGRLRARGAA
jgi:hypothetical protein